ncbi:hypothetical protein P168DRAFT_286484 [Aspergillus campestris IBT 28561]|uniref:Uncharacterized protein n=1 Tax=Aspergillus campestris (strain IBT 28561) TaxID=1392248 RepID=A0A2I1DEQ3_ASPC2|nr:uncharacterized protein P168DRAFT_286484 [Aspergillus campestris IBT 28561]PKY08362.1 hypothetical protein P168DRAFT_286484 [Aspergillus campestris IBT 28561]
MELGFYSVCLSRFTCPVDMDLALIGIVTLYLSMTVWRVGIQVLFRTGQIYNSVWPMDWIEVTRWQ